MPSTSGSVKVPSCISVISTTSVIVFSMMVIAIAVRSVVFPVRMIIDYTMGIIRSYIVYMPGSVNIVYVPEIDVSGVV